MPRRISQGRELSPGLARGPDDAQLFAQSRTLRTKQLLGLDCSMVNLDLAAPSPPFCPIARFSFPFAGRRPSRNQLRKSSSAARRATMPQSKPRHDRFSAFPAFIEAGAVHRARLSRERCRWQKSIVLLHFGSWSTAFEPRDWVAIFLKSYDKGGVAQRVRAGCVRPERTFSAMATDDEFRRRVQRLRQRERDRVGPPIAHA